MKRALIATFSLLTLLPLAAEARGVSPYLPLNLDPTIERQIERLMVLADKPVLKRPFAAATVLDAVPAACPRDPQLCQAVRKYLARYMKSWNLTEAGLEIAASSGARQTIPNSYGLTTGSDWVASARGYWQPSDYALVSLGAVAYEGEVVPEGSMISLGFDRAQLDIGYRSHWFSPALDSSMLIGTQAATMPSITVSNYQPLTRFGVTYEAFVATASESDSIIYQGQAVSGRPRIGGVHLAIEPASGWSLGASRLLQFGGGPRPGGLNDFVRAFFDPARYDNSLTGEQFGNQVAAVTSAFIYPGKTPFTVYVEHAGEDTSDLKPYLLGNASLTVGIHFPRLWRSFDLTLEVSEWQNAWYVNNIYRDGLSNKGHVIGHWGGDERAFGDAVGARSQTLRIGWLPKFGGLVEARLSGLDNENYSGVSYERAYNGSLRYSRPIGNFTAGAEVFAGRNVFGESFRRAGAFVNYTGGAGSLRFAAGGPDDVEVADPTAELFVEAGPSMHRVKVEPDQDVYFTRKNTGAHIAVGARRAVSNRSDLGVRLELDDVDGHTLMSVRALDYRYRFRNPLAISAFLGASRYDLATPAYGLYFGAGAQWRNIVRGWDLGLDVSQAKKVARDHLLPSDPQSLIRPDSFYTINSVTLSLSKRF